uniref:Uncharacterized protein n=1 Tax=Alexandrium monilatum TaxID=311494 RepID=A0A7S4V7S0_9DINO
MRRVVRRILERQLTGASLVLLVIRLDNSTILKDQHRLSRCFGGLGDKNLFLALNGVEEDSKDKDGRHLKGARVLEDPEVKQNLDGLPIIPEWRVAISAKYLLCSKIVDSLAGAAQSGEIDLDKIFKDRGLEDFTDKARAAGVSIAADIRDCSEDEVFETLLGVGLNPMRARSVAKACQKAAASSQVPLLAEAGDNRAALRKVYETHFPTMDPEMAEGKHRGDLPELTRAAEEQRTQNGHFKILLGEILGPRRLFLATRLAVEGTVRLAQERRATAEHELAVTMLPVAEAKRLARKLEALVGERAQERLRSAL